MDQYITGNAIRTLREKSGLTQAEFASLINVSDKAVSKWETGKGYPDITLLEPIARVFRVSVPELLSGNIVMNRNVSANMLKARFYVCPVCGNIIHTMGEAAVNCHGIELSPLEAEDEDELHRMEVEISEDEYYVTVDHPMDKEHFISFIAAQTSDRLELVKLYPEGPAQARVKISGVRTLYFYCNRDGLFRHKAR